MLKTLEQFCKSLYIGHLWDVLFAQTSIQRKHTVDCMLQQGSVAEQCNCMLEEHIIAMLNRTHLPICFWGKALFTYSHLLNMTPLSAIMPNATPYEIVHKRKPDYPTLCVFGCRM
jgi:hypothetical protein